jgi:hypothetical protein
LKDAGRKSPCEQDPVELALVEVKTPGKGKKRAREEITTSVEEDIEKVSFIFFSKLTNVPSA